MKNDLLAMNSLVRRGLKIFLKDKASVFFSLLAPLIILFLYVMFLGDVQMDMLEENMQGLPVSHNLLKSIVDGWMIAGVVSVSCITVSFSSQNLLINDTESGIIYDMLASPVKRGVLSVSYFIYNFVVTLIICSFVLVIAFIYVAISGWYISVADAFAIIGVLILSVASASLVSTLVCMLIKTQAAHSAFVGILSAAVGFLIGAYMPLSMFPKAIQYIVLFIPGTYSAGVFRNLFMNGAMSELSAISSEAYEGVAEGFSTKMDFFGQSIGETEMIWILAVTIALAAAIYIGVQAVKAKRNTLFNINKKLRVKKGLKK